MLALLAIMFIQLTYSAHIHSLTNDEVAHIPAGYNYLKGDFRLNPEHPPLIKQLSAISLLFLNINPQYDDPYFINATESIDSEWQYGHNFLFNNNADKIIFWARIPIILLALLLGFFVYKWSKELWGEKAGLFSLFLYTLSPTVLSQGILVNTDLGIATFMFISFYYFYKLLDKSTKKNLILSGVFFGLAMLSKFTALYMLPMYGVIYAIKSYKEKNWNIDLLKKLVIIGLIALLIINIGYGFNQQNFRGEEKEKFASTLGRINPILTTIANPILKIIPIPNTYMQGLNSVSKHSIGGHEAYLFGQRSRSGWLYYFIITFLFKTPLAILALIALSIIYFKKTNLKTELTLVIPIILYFFFFMVNKINIGHRHIMPIYPFIFVFLGRTILIEKKWMKQILLTAIVWILLINIFTFPHHLSYFNELSLNQGHKILLDSNIDFGQDLKILKNKIKDEQIYLAYWGKDNPDYRNINYEELNCTPVSGKIAISVNYRIGINKENDICFSWLDDYEPIDKAGKSIWIYDIKEIDENEFYSNKCKELCEDNCIKNGKKYLSSNVEDSECDCSCTD